MAILLFIILSLAQLALLAWTVTTQSHRQKARSWTHILLFILFMALFASGLLTWSFRWALLAALLLLLAIRALWRLLRPSPQPVYAGPRRAAWRALALTLLYFLALSPALLFPPYRLPPPAGPYAVGTARHTYRDSVRAESFSAGGDLRHINVAFWYPAGSRATGKYPLVIFSHGGLGLDSSNESLYQELASHGYVVASIGHPYHAFWTRSEDGRITFVDLSYFREIQQEDAKTDPLQSYAAYQAWMATRTADINLALDTILQRAAQGAGAVYDLVDGNHLAVTGHSLGGAAALAMPRQRDDLRAVIALESPFLYDIVGVQEGQFLWRDEPYPVPALLVYSDSAWEPMKAWPQYARNVALQNNPSPHIDNWYLAGAGHFSLTDLALTSPLLVRLLEGAPPQRDAAAYLQELNTLCLTFLDQHLK